MVHVAERTDPKMNNNENYMYTQEPLIIKNLFFSIKVIFKKESTKAKQSKLIKYNLPKA